MGTFILLSVVGYGTYRAVRFVKNNPGQAAEAARWMKQMLTK